VNTAWQVDRVRRVDKNANAAVAFVLALLMPIVPERLGVRSQLMAGVVTTVIGARRRHLAAIHFARVCMMEAAANHQVEEQQNGRDLWDQGRHVRLQTRENTSPNNWLF
jgi:hypothetical protein